MSTQPIQNKIRSYLLGNSFVDKENTVEACQKPLNTRIVCEHIISVLKNPEDDGMEEESHSRRIEHSLLHDLEVFQTYDHMEAGTLAHEMKKGAQLSASSYYIDKLLRHSPKSQDHIYQRQRVLQSLFEKRDQIKYILTCLANNEEAIAWLIECKKDRSDQHSLQDIAFLQNHLLRWLNNNGSFLTAYNTYRIIVSPLIGILMPIIYIIIPFILIRYYFKIPLSLTTFITIYANMLFQPQAQEPGWMSNISTIQRYSLLLSIVFYFQGVFNSVEIARLVSKATNIIYQRTKSAIFFLQDARKLQKECDIKSGDLYNCQFPWSVQQHSTTSREDESFHFSPKSFGQVLSTYHKMDISHYIPILRFTYMIDSLTAISKWCFASDLQRCLVEFRDDGPKSRPRVDIRDVYHPCLGRVVKNDVCIDADNNMIITGPNAGGKSTLLKSFMMAVYLAHIIGVSPCSHMQTSFFTYINTQISVPDVSGVSSLFEAEMRRAKYHLDMIKGLKQDAFAIVAMDEIFNSTNPIEGISAAYAVAHALGKNAKTVSMLTTHYHYLCGLEKEAGNPYRNFKMDVTQDATNGQVMAFHYKLSKGISRQFVALELLRRDHFDDELVTHALEIKNRLLARAPSK